MASQIAYDSNGYIVILHKKYEYDDNASQKLLLMDSSGHPKAKAGSHSSALLEFNYAATSVSN